ncbi:hypothetical protein Tsubulata_040004 [Turnera subulata]|uniref:Uncharacterized protein n=1 Tax=Turnera subulata TaxID=218843 RepID=A0A9Q0FPJ7_9ROSI|nr:hypothetical protein Tsubulata_040004 [Turnera subulata]
MILPRLRRNLNLTPQVKSFLLSRVLACNFCSKRNSAWTEASDGNKQRATAEYSSRIHLSPLFSDDKPQFGGYNIELVDNDSWEVRSGLVHAWGGLNKEKETVADTKAFDDEELDGVESFQDDHDFDEIDNMRIRGSLFYKIDRGSREFEEYSFEFHRRKSSKRKDEPKGNETEESSKMNDTHQEMKRKEKPSRGSGVEVERLPRIVTSGGVYELLDNVEKRVRTPTFNQLTAPYHEPFCLDIYISKASVRACVVHRVTSKVVAVAHSISKDMKFDHGSTRNDATCAAVGKVLAQRALEDDIHNVLYTPRKGERLEGKLQIVLQSIIDNGINVKVKLKQRKQKKAIFPSSL